MRFFYLFLLFTTFIYADINESVIENKEALNTIQSDVLIQKSILEMLQQGKPWYLDLPIVLVTLVMVIVGFLITRQQLNQNNEQVKDAKRIEVISKNRQDWINTLRSLISDYLGILGNLKPLERLVTIDSTLEVDKAKMLEKYTLSIRELITVSSKIELLLNPKEEDSKKLIQLLRRSEENIRIHSSKEKKRDTPNLNKEIIEVSQKILKKEWERVKRED